MTADDKRRELQFDSLQDIIAEARRLLNVGYTAKGKWNLAQTCNHLADWTRFPMDGFPKPPLPLRIIFSGMKMLGIVDKMTKDILENGFKPGSPTAPQTVVAADAMTDEQGVQRLEEVIGRMQEFRGVIQKSPLFGEMDTATWTRVTLLHAQHHLGFLHPNAEA